MASVAYYLVGVVLVLSIIGGPGPRALASLLTYLRYYAQLLPRARNSPSEVKNTQMTRIPAANKSHRRYRLLTAAALAAIEKESPGKLWQYLSGCDQLPTRYGTYWHQPPTA